MGGHRALASYLIKEIKREQKMESKYQVSKELCISYQTVMITMIRQVTNRGFQRETRK